MGLLRRPTPGEIVEGERPGRPGGREFARISENRLYATKRGEWSPRLVVW
jgi:hypothetical protein